MQIFAIVVSLALTAVAVVLTVRAVRSIVATVRIGQPTTGRTDQPVQRTLTMVKETFLHTRMLQWSVVGVMHWFVYLAFIVLGAAVFTAYFQLFDPEFQLPVIGHFFLYEWLGEILGVLGTVGIVYLAIYRQKHHPRREGRNSRFYRSTMWQAYFVEAMALLEGSAILFIRGAEYNLGQALGGEDVEKYSRFHFPVSSFFGDVLYGTDPETLENIIIVIAMIKIVLAMIWLIVISLNLTMGVAWHRFTAWPNIWFKREGSGRTALGGVKPLTSGGKVVSLEDLEDLDEDSKLGVGAIEDFSWKGILDFTTCTECGRCQSQCPAWNTEKPLSPKLLITAMRDHAYAKAPYLKAAEGDRAALLENDSALALEVERPLVGDTGDDWFYNPDSGAAVIDPDVLWNCTSCGACVQQCPVDIEHVDHIIDMRRHQILVESNFPAELNGLFKGLENKGNPWNMSPNARLDWAKGLDVEVKVVGETIESLDEVDWLFWVGCAGAYEDRAKKTTRAVAELLDMAGVSFGVLGNGETCTGDPARRAGNEFVFQGLAQQNAETLKEYKVKKVVSTCAHCFNTLKNEYKEFGVELEVVHHTQLLNRLVREGKLTPVKEGAGAQKRSITYHDPCYIGRHNGVYTPPRELLQILPGAEVVEMERNSERSFCCGAGGARMWMEENIGERINMNRTNEAVETGADQIAVGCPFCRVMLSDGLTMKQSKGEAREEVEVLDVAQMLLASVKGEQATKLAPGAGAATAAPAAAAQGGGTTTLERPVETKAEPEAGDETITDDTVVETQDAGPLAKASGGSSLFDSPEAAAADDKPAGATQGASLFDTPETAAPGKSVPAEAKAAEPTSAGGSLFDLGGDQPAAKATPAEDAPSTSGSTSGGSTSGGSLFDLGGDQPAATPAPSQEAPKEKPADPPAATAVSSGGSLFDIPADEPAAKPAAPEAKADPAAASPAATEPAPSAAPTPSTDLGAGGSLFDIPAAEPAPAKPAASAPVETPEPEPAEPEAPAAQETAAPVEPAAPAAPVAPVAGLGSGGSLFDIAAPAPRASAPAAPVASEAATATPADSTSEAPDGPSEDAAASSAPAEEPAPVAPAAPAASVTPRAGIPEGGSLFDIEAPEPVAAPQPPTARSAAGTASEDTSADTTGSTVADEAPAATPVAEDTSAGAALSVAATQAAATDDAPAQPEAEAIVAETDDATDDAEEQAEQALADAEDDAAQDEPAQPEGEKAQDADPEDEKPKAASNGAAHTPRTDADISGSSSLFDL
ncbi:(Fe-S)-binding protein [Nocardioides sp. Leaf374]|uniref:(Fe-S)-binding protein n=1 Tax=Nocardioides sp. Leaf374 TaxID=2876560 RepID=UPI001E374D1E|nr:(Fe-S)-binding protein [Nocardioides sp. Leaf374]